MGLELKNRFESLAFFAAGPIMLMLNGGMHRPDGPITGATEIVFAAESVTAEYERLKKLGCSFVREPREVTPGSWAAVFSDPDGHWLTAFGPR